jgi:hypothetical protein
MPKHSARALRSPPAMPLDPDDLTLAIEAELAALAEIDADYAEELQLLEHGAGPARIKQHWAKQIEALHRHDREPHVQRLAKLHQQRMALAILPVRRTLH